MMQLFFGKHFQFAQFRNKTAFCKKRLRNTTYAWNFQQNFAHLNMKI